MIAHKRTLAAQPQTVTGINWSNPISNGLVFAFDGLHWRDAVTGVNASATNAPTIRGTADGLATGFTAAANNYLDFPSQSLWNVTGDISILWRGGFNATTGAYRTVISKPESNGAINTPFEMYIDTASGKAVFIRANGSQSTSQTLNTTALSASVSQTIFVQGPANVSNTDTGWIDNTSQSMSITGVATSATTNTSSLRLGRRVDNGTQLDGWVNYAFVWSRQISEQERRSLRVNPWQLFAPRRIWVPVTAAAGGTPPITRPNSILIQAVNRAATY